MRSFGSDDSGFSAIGELHEGADSASEGDDANDSQDGLQVEPGEDAAPETDDDDVEVLELQPRLPVVRMLARGEAVSTSVSWHRLATRSDSASASIFSFLINIVF